MILDTQVVFWLAQMPWKLTDKAREVIRDAQIRRDPLLISDKTLWELAMMLDRGILYAAGASAEFLKSVESRLQVLPITAAIAERSVLFSRAFPKDPSDRIISATALIHGVPLITADEKILTSGEVPCIW